MRHRTPRRPRAERHAPPPAATAERIHKVLAQAGVASRRAVESWIAAGRVAVNGVQAVAGQRVSERDVVTVDGRPVRRTAPSGKTRVIVLNKPDGTVCSRRDPEGRPTVFELLPDLRPGRWVAVGRLDVNTSGVLLFTDDGELAHRLMHPRYQVQREYAVRVRGEVDRTTLDRLVAGVDIDGERLAFDRIETRPGSGANQWFICTLHTGRQREVRRLWEAEGVRVSRLMRIRFGPVTMPMGLRRGRVRELDATSVEELRRVVGLAPPPAPAAASRASRRPSAARPRRG